MLERIGELMQEIEAGALSVDQAAKMLADESGGSLDDARSILSGEADIIGYDYEPSALDEDGEDEEESS